MKSTFSAFLEPGELKRLERKRQIGPADMVKD